MTVSLNKPNPGDRNWDVPVNQNWTTIENALNAKADTDLSNLSQTGEAKFANPSLSNVDSTGKAAAVGWGMPNYSAGVARSINTGYTPTKNVFVVFNSFCNNGGNFAHIYINGVAVEQAGNGYASGWDSLTAYIPKGTTYSCGAAGYANNHSIVEYPLIGG